MRAVFSKLRGPHDARVATLIRRDRPIAYCPLAWIECAFQSASELLKQKDRPEGGLSVALIEAENQATRTPPPADLVTQPLISILRDAGSCCGVKRLVPSRKPNKRCPEDTTKEICSSSLVPESNSGQTSARADSIFSFYG